MKFKVVEKMPKGAVSGAFLVVDKWNDWFKYRTMYDLHVFDESGVEHFIGAVKIGQFKMVKDQISAKIPTSFEELGKAFFSLGQDGNYYENLTKIGEGTRGNILQSLRDVAFDSELFERALDEDVMGVSLLRSVAKATVRGQFRRLATGGVRLSKYEFTYTLPQARSQRLKPVTLDFHVQPESDPPSNIHVLIGRNGVGKTHILNNMAHAIVEGDVDFGRFESVLETSKDEFFANVVSVTFSAFDPFDPLPSKRNKAKSVQYSYIGLKRSGTTTEGKPHPPKSHSQLASEFSMAVNVCRQGARAARWQRALEMLEADPIFREAELVNLADPTADQTVAKETAAKIFKKLSSGHKIVLLTVTRLVETVEERTLVLLDEPEAHLHPPLLSAFVRALSDLLVNRNGVAIIATHSPVVLQEVPRKCAWKIRRSGSEVVTERPEIETFGENVGVLTREAFGLEVTYSGFHKMLSDAADNSLDYDVVVSKFNGQLGGEARAILRTRIAESDEHTS
ncbi:MAG: AAA family ATPase [Vulcanimicrobiaceae bacterium]